MSLNLSNGNSEYTHHIRYMASTSSWNMSDTSIKEGKKDPVPFQFTQAIIDLENIRTGWCVYPTDATGKPMAPIWIMDESLSKPAPKPTDGQDWKRGFKVNVFSKALFGDVPVREYGTNGAGSVKSMEALYPQFEAAFPANAGMVPVVEYKGSVPLKIGRGNTTVPTLVINKWVPRPTELHTAYEQSTQPHASPSGGAVTPVVSNAISEF